MGRSVVVRLDRDWIFYWQVSLDYATTFLCLLLLQYILIFIPCPHQLATRIWDYVTHAKAKKKTQLILTSTGDRELWLHTHSKAKRSHFNWRKRILDYVLTKKIVDSHINWWQGVVITYSCKSKNHFNWRSRILDYVLTKKIPVDSHINWWQGVVITYSRKSKKKKSYFNWQRRVLDDVLTKKIPVDAHINWQTMILVYVLMQNSSGFIHQLLNEINEDFKSTKI